MNETGFRWPKPWEIWYCEVSHPNQSLPSGATFELIQGGKNAESAAVNAISKARLVGLIGEQHARLSFQLSNPNDDFVGMLTVGKKRPVIVVHRTRHSNNEHYVRALTLTSIKERDGDLIKDQSERVLSDIEVKVSYRDKRKSLIRSMPTLLPISAFSPQSANKVRKLSSDEREALQGALLRNRLCQNCNRPLS